MKFNWNLMCGALSFFALGVFVTIFAGKITESISIDFFYTGMVIGGAILLINTVFILANHFSQD